jgi:predicted dehydrogenase
MTVKIGILSTAHMHIYSYAAALAAHSDVALVGVWDSNAEQGTKLAEFVNVPFFNTAEALFAGGLDGVVVTSENIRHRPLVELAAKAGVKAILCEKPLATTVEDAKAMIEACDAAGVSLATAFPCRYSPAFVRVLEQVKSGAIGKVMAIRGTNRGTNPGGWFVDPALSGGGAVIDHTVHVADLNRVILETEATAVYAEIGSGFNHQEWDDTGFLNISYGEDIFATLDTSWSRPKTFPTWGDVTLQIVGTNGVLDLDMFAQSISHYDDASGKVSWPNWGSNIDAGLIADFVKLTAGEEVPRIATGHDGLKALEVALAAYRSAKVGEPVPV